MRASWLLPLLWSLVACSGDPPTVGLHRIVIDAPRAYDHVPTARDDIRKAVQERLGADDTVALDVKERDASYVLHIRIGDLFEGGNEPTPEQVGDAAQKQAGDELERPVLVRLRPLADVPLYEAIGKGKGKDLVTAALAAFDDAWGVIDKARRMEAAGEDALVKGLADPDARLRDFAIVRVGDRRTKAAVPSLCRLLEVETRPELVLRAVGSLVSIGDERAVEPLIELSSRKDPDFVLQLIFAVGTIGGRTAQAYLVTVASGHPVETVRQGAEQALAEMKRR